MTKLYQLKRHLVFSIAYMKDIINKISSLNFWNKELFIYIPINVFSFIIRFQPLCPSLKGGYMLWKSGLHKFGQTRFPPLVPFRSQQDRFLILVKVSDCCSQPPILLWPFLISPHILVLFLFFHLDWTSLLHFPNPIFCPSPLTSELLDSVGWQNTAAIPVFCGMDSTFFFDLISLTTILFI